MSNTIHYGVEDKRIKNIFFLSCGVGKRGSFLWVTKPEKVNCKRCLTELRLTNSQKKKFE